jgi:hypothetical protein
MLAAVETVAEAHPVGESRRHDPDVAAQATAGELVHAAPPSYSAVTAVATETVDRVRVTLARRGAP